MLPAPSRSDDGLYVICEWWYFGGMGFFRLRRDWLLVVITVLASIYVLVFLRPAKQLTAEDLDDPPLFRYAEVTVDRIEPLPWTVQTQHKTLVARFALAWIGNRALLIRTDPEIPPGPTLRGMVQSLHGDEKGWVRQTPGMQAVVYAAELDVSKSYQRLLLGIGGAVFALGALGAWMWRLRKWSAPERVGGAIALTTSSLDVPPPRSDEVVAAAERKHVPLYALAVYFVLYAMLVMAIPGLIVATYLEPQFLYTAPTSRQIEMFVLGFVLASPVTYWPFHWWMRRRRSQMGRVARDGVVTDGMILSAVVHNPRTIMPHTAIEVGAMVAGTALRYRGHVRGVAAWAHPQTTVRVVATPSEPCAILIAPTGQEVMVWISP